MEVIIIYRKQILEGIIRDYALRELSKKSKSLTNSAWKALLNGDNDIWLDSDKLISRDIFGNYHLKTPQTCIKISSKEHQSLTQEIITKSSSTQYVSGGVDTLLVSADSGAHLYLKNAYQGEGVFPVSLNPSVYTVSSYAASDNRPCWNEQKVVYSSKPSVLKGDSWCR